MDTNIDQENINKLVKYGIYYNPACKHYNQEGEVICDKCHKRNLTICIGYETFDMCLQCVQEEDDKVIERVNCPCCKNVKQH